jgi:hypothetical protein
MKRFTEAGRLAIEAKNQYAALSLALMIPDICGSLEDPGTGKSQKRYENWFKKWAEPKFTGGGKIYLSASDCFQLRCSLIHSGSAQIAARKRDVIERIEFFDDTGPAHQVWFQGNVVNGVRQPSVLVLIASRFSTTMFDAADEWDEASTNQQNIQKSKENLLKIRSKGFSMQGVHFGVG